MFLTMVAGNAPNKEIIMEEGYKGQYISKYETEEISNINLSQKTNQRQYPEQLNGLGMFMF